jgi:CheY-like chemotaxis protein
MGLAGADSRTGISKDQHREKRGIGLTLSLRLVKLHGGSLTARSEGMGRGNEFVLRLPMQATPPSPEEGSPMTRKPPPGFRRRVLVVDDNRQAAESLCLILEIWGHQSRMVHNGPDAIREALSYRPDVVLLDIGLPGLDGYTVAEQLRQLPNQAHMTLIAMTGYDRDEDRNRARCVGFDHHLVKPVDIDALQDFLDRHLLT